MPDGMMISCIPEIIMPFKQALRISFCIALLPALQGCVAVTVASTAVSVAGTAVNVGVAAGSAAVGVATTVTKGVVGAGGLVVDAATN
jgi:hypothetical protein